MLIDFRGIGAILVNTIRTRQIRDHLQATGPVKVLLDVGCGTRPYRRFYDPLAERAIGVDLPGDDFPLRDVDVFGSVTDLASMFDSQSADVVLCTEVLHDVPDPSRAIREIYAVLRPGGSLILTTPFMAAICDGTHDHYRYTRHGLRHLLISAGFEIRSIRPVGDTFAVVVTFMIKPFQKVWNRAAKGLRAPWLYSAWNPLLFLTVILPQLIYLSYDAASESIPALAAIRSRFDGGPAGYVTLAVRPPDPSGRFVDGDSAHPPGSEGALR